MVVVDRASAVLPSLSNETVVNPIDVHARELNSVTGWLNTQQRTGVGSSIDLPYRHPICRGEDDLDFHLQIRQPGVQCCNEVTCRLLAYERGKTSTMSWRTKSSVRFLLDRLRVSGVHCSEETNDQLLVLQQPSRRRTYRVMA